MSAGRAIAPSGAIGPPCSGVQYTITGARRVSRHALARLARIVCRRLASGQKPDNGVSGLTSAIFSQSIETAVDGGPPRRLRVTLFRRVREEKDRR